MKNAFGHPAVPVPVSGLENLKPAFATLFADGSSHAAPKWLSELRQKGEARILKEGLPTRALEAWKYTNLAPVLEGFWEVAEAFAHDELPARDLFPVYAGEKSGEIVLLNGCLLPQWSSLNISGVTIRRAHDLEGSPEISSRDRILHQAPIQSALNASLLRDVLLIEVAPGTILKNPIVISSFSFGTESLTKWSASAPRIMAKIGRGAEVAIVEQSAGEGRTIHIPVTSIQVESAARVSHTRVNGTQEAGVQLGSTQVFLGRDSFCETSQFTLSGRLSREDLEIQLTEPGAEVVLNGLYLADGRRHVDHSTSVEHIAPNTTSSQLYKGILNDESRAVFNGRVRIHRAAQQSAASQLNNNLILSKRAEIDTKPELEIDADDVKASHGATIGQIDPEHVFYLRARGIPEDQAVQMLSKGFAQDIAFRIQNVAVRRAVETLVAAALAKTEVAREP